MRFILVPKASFMKDYSFKFHVAVLFYTYPHAVSEFIVYKKN